IEERINNEFFTNSNKYFLPEWGDVRYFQKTDDKDGRSEKKMRLWQTSDREGIEKILNEPKRWNECFDEKQLLCLWEEAKTGSLNNSSDAIEKLFYRVIMIAHYQEHLDRLNSYIEK